MPKSYHLFEVYGIELEYMLVSKTDLKVQPIVDQLLSLKNGELTAELENGSVAWSNELVAHVVEIKTNGPTADLKNLAEAFHKNIVEINALLAPLNAKLLPTAAHPFMDPLTETTLWKHSYSEIYALYNRIFNCKGHGWSNVQSTHINLPFYDDAEFEKLHAAIRLILPLIPSLCASSPILDGKLTGFKDTRLEYYKTNQQEIPEMTGLVIPEAVFNKKEYSERIFEPIKNAIRPRDTENILDHHFLNSRGAIARFDRNAIEIRLVDIQECPKADVAICSLIIATLKALVNGDFCDLETQKAWHEKDLYEILELGIKHAENAQITNMDYLALFGISEAMTANGLWDHIFAYVAHYMDNSFLSTIMRILEHGTLASRIEKALAQDASEAKIALVYEQLANCLQENKLFLP